MTTYNSINDVPNGVAINKELIPLLELLEEVNPCNQSYDVNNDSLVLSYILKIDLLNFFGRLHFNIKANIVGLPISLCEAGYFGDTANIKEVIKRKKGLNIILNANKEFGSSGRTLSTFIFNNEFSTFDEYIRKMRHPYRRRIKKALNQRDKLIIRELKNAALGKDHYSLYRSIMSRTKNPLEILTMEFFQKYDAKLYEFLDKDTSKVVGFIQLKVIKDTLYFMFCGFNKVDNEHYDLYYNMLLKIIEEGITLGIKEINFGQTSEETKLKIGCREVPKYLGVYHSNNLLNRVFQLLLPAFSYKPYMVEHKVFKEDE